MMPKFKRTIYAAMVFAPLACVSADNDSSALPQAMPPIMPYTPATNESIVHERRAVECKPMPVVPTLTEVQISPFTGKVRGTKVRLRLDADLESRILRELDKNELVTIVGEKGNFYAVHSPAESKAFVFRSFVLDNVVEGNRVNIRLEPDMDAPIIGHLNVGERIQAVVSPQNNKWLEIAIPPEVHFYVAKDFIENVGTPEIKEQMDKRKAKLRQELENAKNFVRVELAKSFENIDIDRLQHRYEKIVTDSAEFPELLEKSKEAQVSLQNSFLQKKIAYLEAKASLENGLREESLQMQEDVLAVEGSEQDSKVTDKMLLWQPVEEALYLNWAALNHDRNIDEYYDEQKEAAAKLSGILEVYTAPVKNKPGDYVLRDKDNNIPVAYVYSTKVNLQNCVGKKVNLMALSRPNNNFAFPAYFVLSQE